MSAKMPESVGIAPMFLVGVFALPPEAPAAHVQVAPIWLAREHRLAVHGGGCVHRTRRRATGSRVRAQARQVVAVVATVLIIIRNSACASLALQRRGER